MRLTEIVNETQNSYPHDDWDDAGEPEEVLWYHRGAEPLTK
jgi:hypothetical protein